MGMQNNTTRNASIYTENELILLVIPRKIYLLTINQI